MERENNRPIPFKAVHPGSILRDELDARDIKQRDFALKIGMQPSNLNAIIQGKRDITRDIAIKLEEALGIKYKIWLSLQDDYHYDLKAISQRDKEYNSAIIEEQSYNAVINIVALYKAMNITSLKPTERVSQLESQMGDAYTETDIHSQRNGFFKHSEKCKIDDRNMRTWIILALIAARGTKIDAEYNNGNADLAAKEISTLANNGLLTKRSIKDCLNKYGIGYCSQEKLEKAPIDAFSTIKYGKPVIVVTYRYNDIDKLAFDVLHELCHIGHHMGDGCNNFISYEGLYADNPYEKEANEYARDMLIPPADWKAIMKARPKSSYPAVIAKCIAEEATKRNVSKSIAISRYKHDTDMWNIRSYRSEKIKD